MIRSAFIVTFIGAALVMTACGGDHPSSASNRTIGSGAQDPGVGPNAESPSVDFAGMSIQVGSNATAPGSSGGGDLGGTDACPQGNFTCLCYLFYDYAISCGMEPDQGRSVCEDTAELSNDVYEGCYEAGIGESQCWSFIDSYVRSCLANSCEDWCGFDISNEPDPIDYPVNGPMD